MPSAQDNALRLNEASLRAKNSEGTKHSNAWDTIYEGAPIQFSKTAEPTLGHKQVYGVPLLLPVPAAHRSIVMGIL